MPGRGRPLRRSARKKRRGSSLAFLRFTRDKRGYEHFYLVEPTTSRGKPSARLLYWFRTPPNIRVGRDPFPESVRSDLESQNSGITFDWRRILETPIPSADAEKWRERRRVQRAERAANQALAAETAEEPEADADGEEESPAGEPVHVLEAAAAKEGVGNVEEKTLERRRRRRRGRRGHPGGVPRDSGPQNSTGGDV